MTNILDQHDALFGKELQFSRILSEIYECYFHRIYFLNHAINYIYQKCPLPLKQKTLKKWSAQNE